MKEGAVIGYPVLKHPLLDEDVIVKEKYINLMAYFVYKYCTSDKIADEKIESFKELLLVDIDYVVPKNDILKNYDAAVLKTRFKPFRVFSYRYVFIFDCLLLLAADNRKRAESICFECKSWVNKRFHKKMDEIISLMFEEKRDFAKGTLISEEMIDAWLKTVKFLASSEKTIVFTATMSAGKSSLINAIIGKDLSSVKKAACTSQVIEFHSLPSKRDLYYLNSGNEVLSGNSKYIHDYLRTNDKRVVVAGYFDSNLSCTRIRLVDTPGINSARNPEHKKITQGVLKEYENAILIYVISVENYGADDDYNHLKYIKNNIKYEDIIFVVNMIDTCDFEDDSLNEIISDIRAHLTDIGFINPCVCPISAKAGFELKRRVGNYVVSDNEKESAEDFIRKFSEEEYNLSEYYPSHDMRELNSSVESLSYMHTGIPMFEDMLINISKGGINK